MRCSLPYWAYFALLRAQRARFVRPLRIKGSLLVSSAIVRSCPAKSLLFPEGKRGVRRPPPVAETGRSRRSPEGVEGRGQREALRSPGIPGQRSAGRYEDPSETGSNASALCAHRRPRSGWSVEDTERSGVRRGNPSVSFADSSPYTGEPLGRRKARAVRTRRPRGGWSVEHTERSVVRRHGTLGRRRRDQCVGENMPGRTRAPPKARARAKQASTVRTRRPRSGWSPEDTERSGVRRGGTPRKR